MIYLLMILSIITRQYLLLNPFNALLSDHLLAYLVNLFCGLMIAQFAYSIVTIVYQNYKKDEKISGVIFLLSYIVISFLFVMFSKITNNGYVLVIVFAILSLLIELGFRKLFKADKKASIKRPSE